MELLDSGGLRRPPAAGAGPSSAAFGRLRPPSAACFVALRRGSNRSFFHPGRTPATSVGGSGDSALPLPTCREGGRLWCSPAAESAARSAGSAPRRRNAAPPHGAVRRRRPGERAGGRPGRRAESRIRSAVGLGRPGADAVHHGGAAGVCGVAGARGGHAAPQVCRLRRRQLPAAGASGCGTASHARKPPASATSRPTEPASSARRRRAAPAARGPAPLRAPFRPAPDAPHRAAQPARSRRTARRASKLRLSRRTARPRCSCRGTSPRATRTGRGT